QTPRGNDDTVEESAERELGCGHLQPAADGEAAAPPPRAAGVRNELVGDDTEREAQLEDLDRRVAAVAVDVVLRTVAVARVPTAPAARLEVVVRVLLAGARVRAAEQ